MISVIIPTLQKAQDILIKLIDNLDCDNLVNEIIVIDNSLKGLEHNSKKLRVIIPSENLFVNPSWNLGVKEANNDIIALLNDDMAIPNDFCSDVVSKLTPDMGIIGMKKEFVHNIHQIEKNPVKAQNLYLEKISYRCDSFGIAMFFYKKNYVEIPNEIKIYCGDDWIFYHKQNNKKNNNYVICGQQIYHLQSLSSGEKSFNPILKKDKKIYKKLTIKWYHRIFSFEQYENIFKLRLLGITFLFPRTKLNSNQKEQQ